MEPQQTPGQTPPTQTPPAPEAPAPTPSAGQPTPPAAPQGSSGKKPMMKWLMWGAVVVVALVIVYILFM